MVSSSIRLAEQNAQWYSRLAVPPPIPLRLPSVQLHGPPPPSDLPRRRGLLVLEVKVDRTDFCDGRRGHLLDAGEWGWDGGYWRGQSRDWGSCESAVWLDPRGGGLDWKSEADVDCVRL